MDVEFEWDDHKSVLVRRRKKNSNTIGMNEKEMDYEKGI